MSMFQIMMSPLLLLMFRTVCCSSAGTVRWTKVLRIAGSQRKHLRLRNGAVYTADFSRQPRTSAENSMRRARCEGPRDIARCGHAPASSRCPTVPYGMIVVSDAILIRDGAHMAGTMAVPAEGR